MDAAERLMRNVTAVGLQVRADESDSTVRITYLGLGLVDREFQTGGQKCGHDGNQ